MSTISVCLSEHLPKVSTTDTVPGRRTYFETVIQRAGTRRNQRKESQAFDKMLSLRHHYLGDWHVFTRRAQCQSLCGHFNISFTLDPLQLDIKEATFPYMRRQGNVPKA